MSTNIPIHGEYVCEAGCGYEMVIGVSSKKFLRRSMREDCPRCGSELAEVTSL